MILTPLEQTDPVALAVVDRLWRELGADVEHMQVERHDEVLAATSHLPHLLAFGLVDSWPNVTRTSIFSATPPVASVISRGLPAATR